MTFQNFELSAQETLWFWFFIFLICSFFNKVFKLFWSSLGQEQNFILNDFNLVSFARRIWKPLDLNLHNN